MKHTAGPWKRGSLSYRIEANHNIAADTHDLICEVSSNNSADYNLIAAAPEMLEALELVKKHLEVKHDLKTLDDVMGYVYRAIKKAKGE